MLFEGDDVINCSKKHSRKDLIEFMSPDAGLIPEADLIVRDLVEAPEKMAVIEKMKKIEGADVYVKQTIVTMCEFRVRHCCPSVSGQSFVPAIFARSFPGVEQLVAEFFLFLGSISFASNRMSGGIASIVCAHSAAEQEMCRVPS
jgi:hypothetical protein